MLLSALTNILILITSIVSQVESRFPVAEVAVAVCNAHQDATPVLLGKLHEVSLCPCNRCWAIESLPLSVWKDRLYLSAIAMAQRKLLR